MKEDTPQQKSTGGRPLKFQSVDQLQEAIDLYFHQCDPHMEDVEVPKYRKDDRGKDVYDEEPEMVIERRMSKQVPYTITGLALALDTTRETLLDYENGNRDIEENSEGFDNTIARFSDTIKKAKLRIHNYTELRLFENNPTGPIFNLKNNYGWKDKTEQDITSGNKPLNIALVEFVGDDENAS